jgi:anaerobic selenocysteine-containing dehydrogenase
MSQTLTWCRACEGLCGVTLQVEDDAITSIEGDRQHPNNAGYLCEVGRSTATLARSKSRLDRPLKRQGDRFVEASWEEAIKAIGGELARIRKEHGARSIGIYAGAGLGHDAYGTVRTVAFALGMGTPNLLSELALNGSSLLYTAELMLGYPVALQSDVGRAHYSLLLGGDQDSLRWGPLQSGTVHTQALKYFKRTRRFARLITVGHKTTPLSKMADQTISLRPGTETFYLLGLAQAIASNGWYEHQYLRDYTVGFQTLQEWLAPWTPQRVAEICGVDIGAVSGVALKFSRAAMGTVVRSETLLRTQYSTVSAWVWHIVHALTANLLRPGGAFEAHGLLDHQPVALAFPAENAPRTRVGQFPAVLLQSPATALTAEALTSGEGQLKALITVAGDPVSRLPARHKVEQAMSALELVVAIDCVETATTRRADWVLPSTIFWEREDLTALALSTLPAQTLQATRPVLAPYGESRPEQAILADLFRAASPPLRGGEWGLHLRMAGRFGATADLGSWMDKLLELAGQPSIDELKAMPHGVDEGELNRAEWRVELPDARVDLTPPILSDVVNSITPPEADPELPQWLVTRTRSESHIGTRYCSDLAMARAVRLHPARGLADGSEVIVMTRFGEAKGIAVHDENLREDTIEVPWSGEFEAGRLIGDEDLDVFTGTPNEVGLACSVRPA